MASFSCDQIAHINVEAVAARLWTGFFKEMQHLMGRWQQHEAAVLPTKPNRSCGALRYCCTGEIASRPSLSSIGSSEDIVSLGTEPLQTLSSLAHAMVQERLSRMINSERRQQVENEQRWRGRGGVGGAKVIILVAMDKSSYEPMRDFKESMMEVITSKGLEEPKELRSLLNCYISMNPREQRQTILEAFHEVCSVLFTCSR